MAGKRGNSEGTIRKRADGRWEARYVDADGKRQSLYGKTRQEAARQLNEALRNREQGLPALNERQTVGEYLARWIEAYGQRRRLTSFRRYEVIVRLHLVPSLGNVVLTKLSAQQVQAFMTKKLAAGHSPHKVRYCHRVLRAALTDAVLLGLVHRNVASLVKPPRSRTREMKILSEEQVRELLSAIRGERLEAMVVLALATTMREGELLALLWEDVDLERAAVLVRATLQKSPGRLIREEAKTDHSRRLIALPQTAVEALRRHRTRQAAERLRLGDAWRDTGLVFPNAVGQPIDPDSFRSHWWYPLLKRASVPRIRFHDLRHTAATHLLARGVNVKVVSEMLGHSSIAITLGIYAHVLPHMQQHAAATMDAILRG